MSKASDRLLAQLQQYLMGQIASSNEAAQTESPYLQRLGKDAFAYNDYLHGTGEEPAGYTMNRTPLALSKRQMDLTDNPLQYGTVGAGRQSGGAYQLNYLNKQDKFAGASAQAKQEHKNAGAQANQGVLMGLGQLEDNRHAQAADNMQRLLGVAFQAANNKKPGFLKRLLGAGVQAAPGILAAL